MQHIASRRGDIVTLNLVRFSCRQLRGHFQDRQIVGRLNPTAYRTLVLRLYSFSQRVLWRTMGIYRGIWPNNPHGWEGLGESKARRV